MTWPSERRTLHGEGAHWKQTACVGWSKGDATMRIVGFRRAAELLADHVAQGSIDQDCLIFPFLYNWRQHIELALKELIVVAEALRDIEGKPPTGHNLKSLWDRCRRALEPSGTKDELDNVEHVVAELHAMDPAGDGFRYPRSLSGEPTMDSIDRLSFDRINRASAGVANFIDAASTAVWEDLSMKRELEAEYADYY